MAAAHATWLRGPRRGRRCWPRPPLLMDLGVRPERYAPGVSRAIAASSGTRETTSATPTSRPRGLRHRTTTPA